MDELLLPDIEKYSVNELSDKFFRSIFCNSVNTSYIVAEICYRYDFFDIIRKYSEPFAVVNYFCNDFFEIRRKTMDFIALHDLKDMKDINKSIIILFKLVVLN